MPGSQPVPRLLVVDDEEYIRNFAERALRFAGYEVRLASDGPEALAIVEREGSFALFILDVAMPGMSGDELAEKLRRSQPDAKVLYFTGYSDRLFRDRNRLGDNEAFIDKPVTITGLLEAVSLALFGHTSGFRVN